MEIKLNRAYSSGWDNIEYPIYQLDDRVLPKVSGVCLPEEEYKELLDYKHMYENLCKQEC